MIGYICKYTPIDVLESFGEKIVKINPSISSFTKSDSLTHPNMCSYAKSVIEECFNKNITKIVLINCCDSIRRLYDILKSTPQFDFIHIMDLPRKCTDSSLELFSMEIEKLITHYEIFSGKNFNNNNLIDIFQNKSRKKLSKINSSFLIMGARCEDYLINAINKYTKNVYNLTCTGENLDYSKINFINNNNIIKVYCKSLYSQIPCFRMSNIEERYNFIEKNKQDIKGIIYHTLKFCDYYPFEYVHLKQNSDIPLLKIETDFLPQSQGQVTTRIQAFVESVAGIHGNAPKKYLNNNQVFVAGIDSGSTSTNVVIMNSDKKIVSYSIEKTGAKSIEGAKKALNTALEKTHITIDNLNYITSTGYGRLNIPFANEDITEITCHGRGAHFFNNTTKTIIDIGGQDSKSISIDENGNIRDFVMNDKCAAGTGRFLENMSKILEIPLATMGIESLKWKEDLRITSMCTVFAESEVISLIAENKEKPDIIHGLCNSVASKTLSLVNRVGKNSSIMMTGGVAKNIGVVKCLETLLDEKIFIPDEPQIVGAVGAALFALEKSNLKNK